MPREKDSDAHLECASPPCLLSEVDPRYSGLDTDAARRAAPVEFKSTDAIVSDDPRTGDVIIYADGAAASFVFGRWIPGDAFDPGISKNFDAVLDPDKIQTYLNAAREALLKSLKR